MGELKSQTPERNPRPELLDYPLFSFDRSSISGGQNLVSFSIATRQEFFRS